MDSFTIICASNAYVSEFPSNSLVKFTNLYPNLNLQGYNWCVALQAIFFDATFVGDRPTIIKVRVEEIRSLRNNHILALVPINSTQDGALHFDVTQKEHFLLKSAQNFSELTIELLNENNQKIVLAPGQPTFARLLFTKMAAQQFVLRVSSRDSLNYFPKNVSNEFEVNLDRTVEISRDKWRVAISSIHFPPIDKTAYLRPRADGGQPQDYELPHVILVYSSLVEAVLIGAKRAPIMKMVPISSRAAYNNEHIAYESVNLDFVKIARNDLTFVKFEMRDSAGRLISFINDEKTHINIVFQETE